MEGLIPQLAGWGAEVVALAVGAVFIAHGLPKVRRPQGMAHGMKWPVGAVVTLGVVECLAALCIILGWYDEYAALALAVVMLGALYHKIFKWKLPFASGEKTGWDLELVLLAATLAIAFG